MRRPAALVAIAAITTLGLLVIVGCGGGGESSTTLAGPAQATFPAQNGLISFSGDKGSGAEIYTIKPDGTGLHRLTHVNGDAVSPDWSPDGSRIAFSLNFDEGVYVMNADGGDLHQVTPGGGEPAFTPDGHHLVYWCDDRRACAGGDGVFLIRDDGSDYPGQRLTTNPFGLGDEGPAVSPDGQTVTFDRRKVEGKLHALFAVDIDGTDVRRLTSYKLEVGIGSEWAPNGRRITLTAHADYPDHKSPNVATIKPDGSHLRMLTHYTGGKNGAFNGSYSPDGHWIVFRVENLDKESFRLYRMYPDGTHRKLIKKLPFAPRFSDWGPRP